MTPEQKRNQLAHCRAEHADTERGIFMMKFAAGNGSLNRPRATYHI
jgi:hypothetical protein